MTQTESNAELFYEAMLFEVTKAFALPQTPRTRRLIELIFGKAARSATNIAMDLDRVVGEGGHAAGARWFLPRFVKSHEARGVENIPASGPFVIAANHPGSIDTVVITAHSTRRDLKFIIGDIQFLLKMPNSLKGFIVAPPKSDTIGRMQVVRESLRHLQNGGGLLIFPRGGIEADPEFMPNPDDEFHHWSRSLEIFLKRVPNLQILITIVSGAIAPAAMRHPITWLRKARPDRQRLAFVYQLSRQLLSGKQIFDLTPRVTFGEVIQGTNHSHLLAEIEHAARRTLAQHMEWSNA
ncbi:MAG: hypothetical protein MHPDNHAH_01815 [Anaerolineales bacterium]|nr:hypothetical protein [Anaerolineales bacterium]WKZ49168.1 MAG: 1-acyl-sn-glycerol-3-phosphate acyltransferase [Anaerolineales bacterium]